MLNNWFGSRRNTAKKRSSHKLNLLSALGHIELLEERVVPATDITVVVGAAGTGTLDTFLSATDGTITAADGMGAAGSISTGSLAAVGANVDIDITAETSISFDDLGGTFTLQTAVGNSVSFVAGTGAIAFTVVTNTLATSGADLSLTAGTSLTVANLVSADGAITLTADNLDIGANLTVDSGTGTTTLQPLTAGTLIDLGGADAAGTLGITADEIDAITAAAIVVGNVTAGNLTVTAPIAPSGTNQLELVTAGAILDANATMNDLTVTRLALTAGTGIGVGGADTTLETAVANVEASTTSGGVDLSNSGPLTVGGVSMGLTGISAGGGNISVVATGAATVNDLTVMEAISNTGGGDITLTNEDADSAVTLAINAEVSSTGGNGNITVNAEDDLNVAANISTAGATMMTGTGTIALRADNPTNGTTDGSFTNSGTVTTQAGSITILGADTTIAGAISSTAGGAIDIRAGSAAGDLLVTAMVSSMGGNGNISLSSVDDVSVVAAVSTSNTMMANGSGTVSITADFGDSGVGDFSNSASGTISSQAGSITISGAATTIGAGVSSTGGGGISISAIGATGDLMVNADVRTTGGNGALSLTSNDDVSVTAAVETAGTMALFGTGTVMVIADADNSSMGSVTTSGDGTLDTDSATLTVMGASVTIGATVTADGAANIDITATNGALDINSEISTDEGIGSITLMATGLLSIDGAVSVSGSLSAFGPGTLFATSSGGDVTTSAMLSTERGEIRLTGQNVTIGGTVNATQGGAISAMATLATGDVMVNGSLMSTNGNGNITLSAMDDVTVAATVSTSNSMMTPGTGTISVTASDLSVTMAGSLSTQNGGISGTVANTTNAGSIGTSGTGFVSFSAGANSGTTFTNQGSISSGSGNVTIRYDRQDFQTGSTITVASNREVNLRANTGGVGANLGSAAVGLNFTQAELDTITGGQLRITSAANTTFSDSITLTQVSTLVLEAVGGIIDGTGTEQTDLTVNAVAFKVSTGIGNADDIDLAVTNLGFRNVTSGAVNVTNSGALTISSVFDVMTSSNTAMGAGNTTTISATSPLTFAVNTTTTGDTTYTAGEIDDMAGPFLDDLTVNMGVTVSVSAGNLTLQAGDDVILATGSTVTASGSLTITAGFNDLDGAGGLTLGGTISGDPLTLSAVDDIVVGTITGGTVSITSTAGAILDGNDATTVGTLNITATDLTLSANQGIGVANAMNPTITTNEGPLEVDVTTLTVTNSGTGVAGNIAVNDATGGFSVSGSNAATGAVIDLTATDGGTLTINAGNLTSTNGDITLFTDDIVLTGTVNAGTGAIGIAQITNSFGVIVGTTGMNALLISDAELDQLTAGVVRLGRTTATGNFLVDEAITAHVGFDDLVLNSGGTVTQSAGATITLGTVGLGSLGIQSVGSVALDEQNAVGDLAANVSGATSTFSFADNDDLTVTSVDGIDGVRTVNGALTIVATGAGLTVADTAAMADIAAGTGTIMLIAGNNVTATFTNNAGAAISNSSGNIFILADNMTLTTTSSISTTGVVELRPNTGVAIDLGGADSAVTPTLGLTSDELNTITAGVLGIGVAGTAFDSGSISVTAAIAPTGTSVLRLRTGGGITQTAGSTISVANLRLQSATAITLNEANDVDLLSVAISGTGETLSFTDADDLSISTVNLQIGVTTTDGNITISTTDGNLTVDQQVTAGAADILLLTGGADRTFTNNAAITATGMGNSVQVEGDRMVLNAIGSISSDEFVALIDRTPGRLIDLGSATDTAANTLELSDAELDTVNAPVLFIGDVQSGNITVTATIDPANVTTLNLATSGSITDLGGSLVETNLGLTASTGIGSSATPLDIVATNLEAVTATGGIFLANTGGVLNIGGVNTSINGLQVTTSGAIQLTNNASIIVAGTSDENITSASGNITITATGTTSNVEVRNGGSFSINAVLGNANVQAGQDVLLGDALTDLGGNLRAAGDLSVIAGRDLILDEFTGILVDNGTGNIVANSGRNISLLAIDGTGGALIRTGGGTISITTGVDGTLTLDSDPAPGSFTLDTSSLGGNGDITINADRIDITTTDSIFAGTGIVSLRTVSAGRLIDLGSGTDTALNTLELSDAELDGVTAGVIRVGSSMADTVNVSAAISPMNASTLSLLTGGTVTQAAGISVANLRVESGGSATLTNAVNDIDRLAAVTNGEFSFTDADDLLVDMVDGTTGINALDGVNLTATVSNLNVVAPVVGGGSVNLTASGAGSIIATTAPIMGVGITIIADIVALGAAVNGGSGIVTLSQATNGQLINLGNTSFSSTTFDLSAAELALISGSRLRVGDVNSGAITVTAAVATPNVVNGLSLSTGGGVTQAMGATVTTTNLAITAAGTVNLPQNNDVTGSFAANVTGMGSQLTFNDVNALTIDIVDGVVGVTAPTVALTGSSVSVNANVTGGTMVTLTATEGIGAGNSVTVATGVTVSATTGSTTLSAGDNVTVNGTVRAGAGSVTLNLGAGDTDATSGGTINGTVDSSMQAFINGSPTGGTTLTVNTVTGDFLGGEAVFNGTGTNNAIVLDGSTGTAPQTFDLDANLGILDADFTSNLRIGFNIQTLTASGGSAGDTFNVTPGATTTVNVNGNAPTSGTGDTLDLELTGVAGTLLTFASADGSSGSYSFSNRASVNFTGIETNEFQTVTLAVTDAIATERGPLEIQDPGQFTLTRSGDLSQSLTVNYTISGTAANGVDFTFLGGTVTFAAGSSTATIDVNAINNSIIDGNRTVTITLNEGAGYIVQSTPTGTVTIRDNDSAFSRVVTGSSVNGDLRVFDNGSDTPTFALNPFPGFAGGIAVAVGDVTGDGIADFAAGVAGNGPSHVKVFDGVSGAERLSFLAFDPGYTGGVNLAIGDLNGDGRAELIVGSSSVASHVKVFDGLSGVELASFYAYPTAGGSNVSLPIGVSVGAGDTDGDGRAEIITGSRLGAHVKTFDINGTNLRSFFAFDQSQVRAGITVAAGDINGDGVAEIIVGGNANGQNLVNIFNPDNSLKNALAFPNRPTEIGASLPGPNVATADADGDDDIDLIVTLGANLFNFDGPTLTLFEANSPYGDFNGGVFVGG